MTAADLSVLGVDDVELRELELSLVTHGHGGVVPPVGHLGHQVRNCSGNRCKFGQIRIFRYLGIVKARARL